MIAERGLARKVLIADLALEGFLTSVDPEMVVKMAPVVELAATLLAFKRPLTCVGSDVFLQFLKSSSSVLYKTGQRRKCSLHWEEAMAELNPLESQV